VTCRGTRYLRPGGSRWRSRGLETQEPGSTTISRGSSSRETKGLRGAIAARGASMTRSQPDLDQAPDPLTTRTRTRAFACARAFVRALRLRPRPRPHGVVSGVAGPLIARVRSGRHGGTGDRRGLVGGGGSAGEGDRSFQRVS
jgi:hypothetical protein